MLVLSRKKNEVIRIGDDISVMVIEVRGNKVRLGIVSPKHVSVHRQEIWLLVQEELKASESDAE